MGFIASFREKEQILVVGNVQSGKTRYMLEKSLEALEGDYDCAIVLGGSNNSLVNQTSKRFNANFDTSKYFLIDMAETPLERIPEGKTVITLIKAKDKLEKLEHLLNMYNGKIIIFDDESDFGSINQGGDKRTTINRLIYEIFNNSDSCTLLSITATPFADILSDTVFSNTEVLEPYDSYCGSSYFLENNLYDVSIVDSIEDEIEAIDFAKILIDHIKRVKEYHSDHTFEKEFTGTQLLINNNLHSFQHEITRNEVLIALEQLKSLMTEDLELIEELYENTIIKNGEYKEAEINFNKNSIIIGGHLISRGFTFETLITTVMFNEPNKKHSADTLLQRARWFGNRSNYSKYMKVIISEKTLKALKECDWLLNKVYKSLKENSINKVSEQIKNYKFEFIKPTGKKHG